MDGRDAVCGGGGAGTESSERNSGRDVLRQWLKRLEFIYSLF